VRSEEQTLEVQLETLYILGSDLGMKPSRGLQRTTLYRTVDGGPTATITTRTEKVKIES
jgi:hypothetical protein